MRSATFNPLAARELGEATEYYDEARQGLGEEFLHEVERAIVFLDQYPEAAPKVGREVRRRLLARFPYSVIYCHRPLAVSPLNERLLQRLGVLYCLRRVSVR